MALHVSFRDDGPATTLSFWLSDPEHKDANRRHVPLGACTFNRHGAEELLEALLDLGVKVHRETVQRKPLLDGETRVERGR